MGAEGYEWVRTIGRSLKEEADGEWASSWVVGMLLCVYNIRQVILGGKGACIEQVVTGEKGEFERGGKGMTTVHRVVDAKEKTSGSNGGGGGGGGGGVVTRNVKYQKHRASPPYYHVNSID
ncbi:hypothetical protein M0804_008849 [Polistes exclamans]|nr:hypothetical protein M0804_008849 [Polistes exclamans]